VGKRYTNISYDAHAEEQLAERKLDKELVELVLETATVRYPSRGMWVAEALMPGKDILVLRVVYLERSPEHAYVVTAHPLPKSRSRIA
jgi:hypothetical protein